MNDIIQREYESLLNGSFCQQDKDDSTQVSEALIKVLVAQICKDLPQETAKLVVNPNEVSARNDDFAHKN